MRHLEVARRVIRRLRRPQRPAIKQPRGTRDPYQAPLTFVVVCGAVFDQTILNAGTTARMGWCHGFEQLGIPYLLVSIFELRQRLAELTNPLIWIAASDYAYLNQENAAALRRTRHIVWVDAWFDGEMDFYRSHDFPNRTPPSRLRHMVLDSEPSLFFTISPVSSFHFYEGWQRHGAQLVSLPLACDTALYRSDVPDVDDFAGVKLAFVGGYWSYKARQFDRYLRPYADRLTVFGYSAWPYAGYGGQLEQAYEPSLYRQADLSPTINEPHIEVMGIDLNERVFKVLGSGGLTITDVSPGYREWFDESELLVPGTVREYHELVATVLNDVEFGCSYRKRGLQAVQSRHTYAHRAQDVLMHLKIRHSRPA